VAGVHLGTVSNKQLGAEPGIKIGGPSN